MGRPNEIRGAWTPEKVRQRIRVSALIRRLKNHALNRVEMSATQVNAAKILLAKCIPDLRAIDISGSVDVKDADQLSTSELYRRISALEGAASTPASSGESPEVH